MLVAWSSFVKGNFDHAEELLDDMSAGSVDSSSDLAKEAFGLALSGTIAGVNQNYNECEQMCAASLRVVSHLDSPDPITLIFSHLGLSIAACGLGNYANARQSILAALGVAQQLGTPAFTLVCLPNIAIIEAHEVNFENAVKIISFVYSDSAITPTWLRNWDLLAQLHASLETEMDHSLFQELWAQGKDLDVGLLMKETISRPQQPTA
jgi:ATP/maltotriose-dependent transcriptional regulator MalT